MNRFLCACAILLALCSCQVAPPAQEPAEAPAPAGPVLSEDQQKAREKAAAYIEKIKNSDNYYGEGLAQIQAGQLDAARNKAITQARDELSKAIRVHVASTFYELTRLEKGVLTEEVKSRTSSYADTVIRDAKVEHFFNYPQPGHCTALAWVSRKAYRDQVDKEIKKSMDLVAGPAREALKAQAKRNYALALRCWATAHGKLDMLFPGLTFHRDLDGDEQPDDARAYIDARLADLLGRIQIRAPAGSLEFNLKGELLGKPEVRAQYVGKGSERYPVFGLQLSAATEPAGGEFDSDHSVAGADGAAEIKLRRVDGRRKSASLRVELAEDLPTGKGFGRPFCIIPLRRLPLVCLAVTGQGGATPPARLGEELRSILAENRFEVQSFRLHGAQIADADMQAARDQTADYILAAAVSCRAGEDSGLPYVEARAQAVMRDLQSAADVVTIEAPWQRRYGENRQTAEAALVAAQADALLVRMKAAVRLAALQRDPAARAAYVQQQQQAIAALANGAQGKLKTQRYAAALDDLLRAQQKLDALLPGATFQAPIGTGQTDVRAWLSRELRGLVQSIHIQPQRPIWTFDRNGELELDPAVIARVGDSPADGLPLEATIAKGRGNLKPQAVVDRNGLARIFVRRIAQPCKEAVVVVRIDRPVPGALRRPPCRLLLRRVKVVACHIPDGFDAGPIEEAFRRVGMVPVAAGAQAGDADYRFAITTEASKPKDNDGIFFVTVSATGEMVPAQGVRKERVFTFTVGPEKGYGTQAQTAEADALAKVRKKLPDALASALSKSQALDTPQGEE